MADLASSDFRGFHTAIVNCVSLDHGAADMEIRKKRWVALELTGLVKLKFPLTSNTFVASRDQFVLGKARLVAVSI